MDPGYSNIFLSIPTIIVIILNIFFLCNVIKVLKSKLQFQSVATLPRSSQDARAASVSGSGKEYFYLIQNIFVWQLNIFPQ